MRNSIYERYDFKAMGQAIKAAPPDGYVVEVVHIPLFCAYTTIAITAF